MKFNGRRVFNFGANIIFIFLQKFSLTRMKRKLTSNTLSMNYLDKKKYIYESKSKGTSLSICRSSKKSGLSFVIETGDAVGKVQISDRDELLKIAEYIRFHADNDLNANELQSTTASIGVSIVSMKGGRLSHREIFDATLSKRIDGYSYQELAETFGANGETIVLFQLYDGQISRESIVRSIIQCIEFQKLFVMTGLPSDCRRMALSDVKEKTGLDVTIISRCTKNVRIYTPGKTFTLDARGGGLSVPSLFDEGIVYKDVFFGHGEPNLFEDCAVNESQKVSRIEVLDIINNLIVKEDRSNPLTDDKISEELRRKGYAVSRRTVAKYRETFLGHGNSKSRYSEP